MSTDSPLRPRPPAPPPLAPGERLDRQRLLDTYAAYGKPRSAFRVGGEFERPVVRGDGRAVAYDEADGIRWILEEIGRRQPGWIPYREEGHLIALEQTTGASVTLEPGGQVELSGAPFFRLRDLAAEMYDNRRVMLELAEGRDLHWLACGYNPIVPLDEIPWMPKARYRVMREYLPQVGDLALAMMKGTSSVQANFDFEDEADCARKVRAASGIAPLITAIFSNSPLANNRPTGFASYRGHIWTRTDPARTGFPLRSNYSHEGWVDYLLDVPMMFYKRGDAWVPAHGATFRTFMERGLDGHFPSDKDWALHQTSVFPEVRVKHTIEVRSADCVAPDLAVGFCALFTGLLYDDGALDEAIALTEAIEGDGTAEDRFIAAARHGLDAPLAGRKAADWARDLGEIARKGLSRVQPDDVNLMEPLLALLDSGRSPAVALLEAWHHDPRPENILRAAAY